MTQASSIGPFPPPQHRTVVQANFRCMLRVTATSWGLDVPAQRGAKPLAPALRSVLQLPRRRAGAPGF